MVGANLLTARSKMRMRRSSGDEERQDKTRIGLVKNLAKTSYWKENGIEPQMSQSEFRENVSLRNYEAIAGAIERTKRGEFNVLWPGRCSLYAISSGTTAGRTKYLPITKQMIEHFKDAGLQSLFAYTARVGHVRIFQGRHLFLGGSTALAPIAESKPFEAFAADLSGICALNLPRWVERNLYEPGAEIAQMEDWPAKIAAIARRTAPLGMTLLGGIPSWALILAAALRSEVSSANKQVPNLQAIWPNFECFMHGGVPIGPYQDELRAVLGPTVQFHEVYPASEAFIAVQDSDSEAGLRLLTDAGIYYEFLPMSVFDEAQLSALGSKAVPLAEVQVGVDYALILTTPAGLARYVIGDVVRFTSTAPARLRYIGRTKLQLSAFGEHVIEIEVTEALLIVSRRHALTVVNFHVAPIFADSQTGRTRGCHEWWIEFRQGTVAATNIASVEAELDAELRRMNDDYDAKRKGGGLSLPVVQQLKPGVFELWMKERGKWGGQNKMPRCRSDRAIADELARMQNQVLE